MSLTYRTKLTRPLTHEELDYNFTYLNIIDWIKKGYEKGQYVIFTVSGMTNMYYCETSHTDRPYTLNGGIFVTEYVEGTETIIIWRKMGTSIKSGYYDGHYIILVTDNDEEIKIPFEVHSASLTGATLNIDYELTLESSDGSSISVDLSPLAIDTYVTGATVDTGTSIVSLQLNNDKPDISFDLSHITSEQKYITGGTSSADTGGTTNIDLILDQNDNTSVDIDLSPALTYKNDNAVKKTVGGISTSDTPFTGAGKTLQEIIQAIFYPALAPTSISYSSASLYNALNPTPPYPSTTSLVEIGYTCSTALGLTAYYTRGQSASSPQPIKYMGLPNTYIFSGSGTITTTYLSAATVYVHNITGYVVTQGVNSWAISINYNSGDTPVYDDGTSYPTPAFSNSGTKTSSTSIEGVFPLFGTTSSIGVLTKQPLVSMISGNYIAFGMKAESGGNKQTFEIPNAWLSARSLAGIQTYNTVSAQWEYQGGSAGTSLTYWTTSAKTETIQGNTINYTQYVFNGSDRGDISIRLVF